MSQYCVAGAAAGAGQEYLAQLGTERHQEKQSDQLLTK